MNALNPALANVPQCPRHLSSMIPIHLRWHVSNPLTLRALEEVLSEGSISIDHSTSPCRACELLPCWKQGRATARVQLAEGQEAAGSFRVLTPIEGSIRRCAERIPTSV